MKRWAHHLCFYFPWNLVWNISHYKTKLERYLRECINSTCNISVNFIRFQWKQYVYCANYETLNPHYTVPLPLLLTNVSFPSQITHINDRQSSVSSVALSTDFVDIASVSVLSVDQWTWYMHVVSASPQRRRTSGKCSFVTRFIICSVLLMFLSLPNQEIWVN